MENNSPYSHLAERLDAVRRKELRLIVAAGSLAAIVISMGVLLLTVVLEEVFQLGTAGRTALFLVPAFAIVFSIIWFAVRPLLRKKAGIHEIAERVGGHFPSIRDRLLDAIQMYEQRDALGDKYSVSLIDASFSDLYRDVQSLDLTQTVDDSRLRKMRKTLLYAAAVVILTFVISPSDFYGSLYRLVNFNTVFAASMPVEFEIEPGNADIIRGQSVPIAIRTKGREARKLTLLTRQYGQIGFDETPLTPSGAGEFRTELKDIKSTTEYLVSTEDVKSGTFTITVIDRPIVKSLRLKVAAPAYTRIPPKTLDENVGDIDGYPGSKVTGTVSSSKELSSAEIVFADSTRFRLPVNGSTASVAFGVRKNGKYRLLLRDKNNLLNIDPIEYTVTMVPDEYPTVELLAPGKDIDITDAMKADLFIRLKDDFGFTKLRLAYRLAQSKYEKPKDEFTFVDIPFDQSQNAADVWHHWDLTPLNLVPEDAVAYYVEVFDNDNVSGPKQGHSATYMIRLPSLEEVLSDVAQSQQNSMESMQNMAKETQELKKDVETLQRELKKNPQKMDWQQQQKVEQMLQKYEAMKKTLDQTSKEMDEMMKKADDNKLLSEQTMEKYQELQKLMEQLNSPELQDALKKLQQSMKQLSPEQMKQSMEQLKTSEDQFRKNIERIVELLKRIHIEQKLDELIKRTEELDKQQESLREQTAKTNPSDEQKRSDEAMKQDDLKKQMESLEQEASNLEKKMEEFPKEMPVGEMEKTLQQMEQDQTGEKMDQASQQMKAGQMSKAEEKQKNARKDLSNLQQSLQNVRKQMRENQQKQIVEEMKKQLQNLIELSKEQEDLKNEAKSLDPNSQRFRENGERQSAVRNDLANVANSMSDLGKKTFAVSPEMGQQVGNAMKQMDEAIQQTEGRNPAGTSQKQGEAMSSLNKAAMMMQGSLNGMQGQGGMGMAGLLGRLGQMANQQGGINSGTQGAMGMGGEGQGMTSQQQAEYQRLSGQQEAVRKSLEELSKEAKNAGEFSKLLGDLDQLSQQMQEVQTDLVQGNVNPETIQKQDKILSRLLDAAKSTRERDYEKRRRSETGKALSKASPLEIDLTTQEGKNRFREELLKIREGKYSKDFEELIRRYFEQLEKEKIAQ